ncbi:MAG: GTP-binding protein [Candidatus Heimdallarchaeota archaeon]|nr:GTP-binding protein [Candidatus Heimdallarchaeota archaeon]
MSEENRKNNPPKSESIMDSNEDGEKRPPIIKVVIAGKGGIGKTTLCKTATSKINDPINFEEYKLTIGVQFFTLPCQTSAGWVSLSIWDLAGQEQFEIILNHFLRGTRGIILAYDSTSMDSYMSLHQTWIPLITKNCNNGIPILMVSMKNDLPDSREVDPDLVQEFLEDEKDFNFIGFLEVSSKAHLNVEKPFDLLAEKIVQKEVLLKSS